MIWRCAFGLGSIGLALLLIGCSSSQKTGSVVPYFQVLESRPAPDSITADEIYPLSNDTRHMRLIEDNRPHGDLPLRMESTDRFQAQWKVIEGEERELFFRVSPEGHRLLTAVIEPGKKAISLFNPPLIGAYASLAPGETREQSVAMRVMHLDHPRRMRDQGTVRQTISYRDRCELRIGDQSHVADRIKIVFEADLRFANIIRLATLYIERGRGVIAESSDETIVILGLFPQHTEQLRVLLPASEDPGS